MVHKPVMFMTISPGALGGVRAQYQLRETLSSMHCRLAPMSEIVFPHVGQKVSQGKLADEASIQFVSTQVERMLEFASAQQPA
jgi:chromate reductase